MLSMLETARLFTAIVNRLPNLGMASNQCKGVIETVDIFNRRRLTMTQQPILQNIIEVSISPTADLKPHRAPNDRG